MRLFKSFRVLNIFLCTAIGLFGPIVASAASGPLVLYTFDEGNGSVVHDISGNGEPLDLSIKNVENTHWLPGGGLAIDQPTVIAASISPDKIVDAIKATNNITIEAWIQPANEMQSGPARIATLSNGTDKRNFTLGQQNASYDVRLRSTSTTKNGTPSVSSADNTLSAKLTHVVYTRNSSGIAKIFIDGVRKSRTTISGDPSNWSDTFSFVLANETSGNRPWLGHFYRFAIYKRALGKTEIVSNFEAGAGIKPVHDGPLALYTFAEGSGSIVHDRSDVGTALDLKIADTAKTSWLPGGGLSVNKATIISGNGSRKIIDAVKASNAITIEAWLKPANTIQDGPARIVTLSADTSKRDFTLGQQKAAYDVRLRSTATDLNGTPSLASPSGTLNAALTHVIYTRSKDGIATLFINGNKQSQKTVSGDFSNWNINHGFAVANELTGGRPWLGKLYLVAIYDRALNATEIDKNFAQGAFSESAAGTTSETNTSSNESGDIGTDSSSESGASDPVSGTDNSSGAGPTDDSSNTGPTGTVPEVGSTTVSWIAPVARSNGEALSMSEITGYSLYYGMSAGDYSYMISIDDAYTTSMSIKDLPPGTYYFVVTAHDTNGQESALSNTATKVVN